MYEKEQLREYVEKFALNYLQLLVHPNPPSVLFGADKDTGLMQVHLICVEPHPLQLLYYNGCWEVASRAKTDKGLQWRAN